MAFTAADGAEQAEAVSELILATLRRIVEAGFAADALEASMNSMEFRLRSSSASPMKVRARARGEG